MRFTTTIAAAVLAMWSQAAAAQITTLTQAGYTGLGITPNALLIDWGRVEATYDRQLPGIIRDPTGHNFAIGFGLLPNLEIAGRLATNSIHRNCFTEGCGTRDLSASGKLAIGLDTANRFHVAVGASDVGGAATNFRTYYGVLTYNEGPFEASAGLARRSGARATAMSPLHGPFAAAAWQPLPWVRGHLEYADGNAWAGLRLFAPDAWLPEGWRAHVGTNHRLNDNNLTRSAWLTAGLSIPLYKVPTLPGNEPKAPLPALSGAQRPLPAYEARSLPPSQQAAPGDRPAGTPPPAVASPVPPRAPTDADLERLADALQAKGLEDISVGRMPDGSVAVRANNAAYNWNSADALGVALGAVARTLADNKTAYRLILTQRQTPLVAVTGQADCLRDWIANEGTACAAGQLSTPGTGALEPLHEGAAWVVRDRQPRWHRLRVTVGPALHTNIGTELGALDYSAGLNVGLQLPLWSGASAEWRRNVPLAHSSDYEDGGGFATWRIRPETERLAVTQTLRLPLERWLAPGDDAKARRWGLAGVTAQASVGRFGGSFDGVHGAARWEPGEGVHRLSAETGWFRNDRYSPTIPNVGPRTARPLLASYRYAVTPTRTYLEASAGQFFYNDRGIQLGLRQWFSDVAVRAYYKRSSFEGAPTRQFVGLELSLPIGPRRDPTFGRHLQVGGTPRFAHAKETLVRDPAGNNAVRPGFGLPPPTPSLDAAFNSDRAGLVYFEDNIRRIRDAAR